MQTRSAAEAAVGALHGVQLHNCAIKVAFGKAVALPAAPIYPPSAAAIQMRERVQQIKASLPGAPQQGRHAWGRGAAEASPHVVVRPPSAGCTDLWAGQISPRDAA